MTFIFGLLLVAAGVVLLVFRKRAQAFWAQLYPHSNTGFMYVWLYIFGPLFVILLGATVAIGALLGR